MAEGKNKIIVYRDWLTTFDALSDEEAGRLIKHFFRYVNDHNPEAPDRITALLFEPIKQTLKRDLKRYEAICLRNRNNGQLGGRPRQTEDNPEEPSGFFTNPNNPDKPDSDSDSDIRIESKHKSVREVNIEFYLNEKERTDDKNYHQFVDYILGKNTVHRPLDKILKMADPVGVERFNELLRIASENSTSIIDKMNNLENSDKKYKSFNLTISNWLKNKYTK